MFASSKEKGICHKVHSNTRQSKPQTLPVPSRRAESEEHSKSTIYLDVPSSPVRVYTFMSRSEQGTYVPGSDSQNRPGRNISEIQGNKMLKDILLSDALSYSIRAPLQAHFLAQQLFFRFFFGVLTGLPSNCLN